MKKKKKRKKEKSARPHLLQKSCGGQPNNYSFRPKNLITSKSQIRNKQNKKKQLIQNPKCVTEYQDVTTTKSLMNTERTAAIPLPPPPLKKSNF